MASNKTRTAVILAAVLIVSSIGLPLMAGTTVAQENNTTATDDSTTTSPAAETCENPTTPQMDQARLYAPQKTITPGEAGRIDGGFQLSNTVDCPVEVAVTLRVPSGMSISGGSDWGSAGVGMVTTTFTMQPGSGIRDLSGNVYSEETGQLRVTGDIEYWPAGHPEMSQEIDGLTFNFDVQEPNSPPGPTGEGSDGNTSGGSDGGDGGNGVFSNLMSTLGNNPVALLGLLVALGIIGMMYVAPKVGVDLRK